MEQIDNLAFYKLPLSIKSTNLLLTCFKFLELDCKDRLIESYNILVSIKESEETLIADFEYSDSGRVYRIEFNRGTEVLSLSATHPDVYPNIISLFNCLSLSSIKRPTEP